MKPFQQVLELDKVLAHVARYASNEGTRDMLLSLEPQTNLADVQQEIEKTDDALTLSLQYGTPPFSGFQNICNRVTRCGAGAKLTLRDLLDVADMLRAVQGLSQWYAHCSAAQTSLDYLFSLLIPEDDLFMLLDRSILNEDEISDAASATLSEIRRKLLRSRAKLRETLDGMIRSKSMQKMLQETAVTIRDGRFVLPVKSEYRSAVGGLIHGTSASGQTLFIEPLQIVEANNDIRLLESREIEEIERIIQNLCTKVGQRATQICRLYDTLVELNFYFAKANYACDLRAIKPIISDDGILELHKARHPLLPLEKAVPITVFLGGEHRALIVTGPNTGGKTVSLKTTGLLTAMVMCGLLIPVAEGSRISIFRHILADIGDSQSIEQNLSTFSSHTLNVVEILNTADESSLVLLDELGSGTDPVEGAALAIAVIDSLKAQGAILMVTTHYQELKLYAADAADVLNASCEFDTETLSPTYRLILGSPGKSNAFSVSGKLGMPSHILAFAESLISEENKRFEQIISRYEEERLALERERMALKENLAESERMRKELAEQHAHMRTLEKEKLERASVQANVLIETAKARTNALLDELDMLRKEKDKADFAQRLSIAKGEVNRTIRELQKETNPIIGSTDKGGNYVLPRPLKKGDRVIVSDLGQEGTIAQDPGNGDTAMVQMGMMKMKIQLHRLRLLDQKKGSVQEKKKQKRTAHISSQVERKGSMELDIRGETCDDGVYEMEQFLDHAIMSHIGTVTIIHGKGTGQLRNAIRKRLKSLKHVKEFRSGLYGEGEDGVTIVTLQ